MLKTKETRRRCRSGPALRFSEQGPKMGTNTQPESRGRSSGRCVEVAADILRIERFAQLARFHLPQVALAARHPHSGTIAAIDDQMEVAVALGESLLDQVVVVGGREQERLLDVGQ